MQSPWAEVGSGKGSGLPVVEAAVGELCDRGVVQAKILGRLVAAVSDSFLSPPKGVTDHV